ncbi:MAG: Tellurium resistance protein TerA [Micavibrio sp.]|nr:Tellurium resistance protein TerA [Micavibrio sp.]|tara:strand:+ start:661 stop:1395 length:735 start_codon:yes stop_codon:yes gene_type:complete
MSDIKSSESMRKATESRADFSGRGNALGAAGYINPDDVSGKYDFIKRAGETMSFSPPEGGFKNIKIAAAWDVQKIKKSSLFGLIKTTHTAEVDLDLGCLYEMQDGRRGAIQAFGDMFGDLKEHPFIRLSGDERTGAAEGDDEYIVVNGQKWPEIKRLLVYVYIYKGAMDWSQVRPQIQVRIPGEQPLVVTLSSHMKNLGLCVLTEIKNVRNGMMVENYTEYFPGHNEMDRAYGFGLEWADGAKT